MSTNSPLYVLRIILQLVFCLHTSKHIFRNRALPTLHGRSLKIMLTIPFNYYNLTWDSDYYKIKFKAWHGMNLCSVVRVLKRPNFAINKNLQFKKNVKNKIVFIPYSSPEHRFFILQQRSATEKILNKNLNH